MTVELDTPMQPRESYLFLLSTLQIGGSERKTVRLANTLAESGHPVTIAYLNEPAALLPDVSPAVRTVHLQRRGKFSLTALRGLRHLLRHSGVDTLVAINLYPALYAGVLQLLGGRRPTVRIAAWLNTSEFGNPKMQRRMTLYRPLLRRMPLLLFGAEQQRQLWLARYFRGRAPHTAVLYNGLDTEYFSPQRVTPAIIPGWQSQRLIIGTVGVLRPEKAHGDLLQAGFELVARGHDIGLVFVGAGPELGRLKRMAAQLGMQERVHWAGALRDVRAHLAAFDVFALMSTAVETFSNAALEAMAMQRPVVASRVGGMAEMLASQAGLLYEPGNVPELVEALESLITAAERRDQLGINARAAVCQRFSLSAMADQFRELLSYLDAPGGGAALSNLQLKEPASRA